MDFNLIFWIFEFSHTKISKKKLNFQKIIKKKFQKIPKDYSQIMSRQKLIF